MAKVQGKENLVKNDGGGVVNTDHTSYKMAKHYKKRILEEKKEKDELKQRVEKVEALLQQLMEKPKPQRKRSTTTKKEAPKDE